MKLSELNPREKFFIDNKGGVFQIEAAGISSDEIPETGYAVKCLCCTSLRFMSSDTEVFTLEYGTPVERLNYDKGYGDYEKLMMKFIEKWNGETNSALGDLLSKRFNKMLLKRYESHKSPNQ